MKAKTQATLTIIGFISILPLFAAIAVFIQDDSGKISTLITHIVMIMSVMYLLLFILMKKAGLIEDIFNYFLKKKNRKDK